MALEQFELRLVHSKTIGPSIKHLELTRTDEKLLDFVPGQFITLLLKNEAGELKRRSYSIANNKGEATLAIAVSYIAGGIASELLFNLKPGDTIKAMGPAGRLVLPDESFARMILVGTGTGIAPYRSMLPALHERLAAEPHLTVHLLLGVQYRESALYAEDFLAFAVTHPQFHFHAALSRETTPLAPHEIKGHVQAVFDDLHLCPTTDLVYLCGNPNMIDESFQLLVDAGFPTPQIRREKYISS